ncbi:hypothetical protein CMI37_29680 [Candidatus Pacearchaeota archaeon]|nr:hypothetical protein [Candidatus Pacearchaeota archaeon]|tara:strand:+ start:707 stop:904 length:198 start_codon:yes stop_codon:yes gene_type:complete
MYLKAAVAFIVLLVIGVNMIIFTSQAGDALVRDQGLSSSQLSIVRVLVLALVITVGTVGIAKFKG